MKTVIRGFKYIFFSIVCLGLMFFSGGHLFAQSPTDFGRKIIGLPESYAGSFMASKIGAKKGKATKTPWVVFSDRGGNYTINSPKDGLVMHKLSYLQPFYVSEEKDGYLKLIKFQEGLLKGLKFKSKSAVESYGWIEKDKLLLWQQSEVDQERNFPQKSMIMVNGVSPLLNPQAFFAAADSVWMYDGPEIQHPVAKVALHSFVYVYKVSPDQRSCLVGLSDQFVPKEAQQQRMGWVSREMISDWGHRLYVAPKAFEDDNLHLATAELNATRVLEDARYLADPLLDTSAISLLGLPVVEQNETKIFTKYALDVFDKQRNAVLTINGSELNFPSILALLKQRRKVNIIYVLDGGGQLKTQFSGLLNTIQSFEGLVDQVFNSRDVRYGAVVFRNSLYCQGGNASHGLTQDYRSLMNFLKSQAVVTRSCRDEVGHQPWYSGLEEAISLVGQRKQQTNLFVLVGTVGNLGSVNAAQQTRLAQELAEVDGRLLVMQAVNNRSNLYNDFVVQARQLVSEEAFYASERRKYESVRGEANIVAQPYGFNFSDSISFYLDFPRRSLVQGAVIFPGGNQALATKDIKTGFSRLLDQTSYDIKHHLEDLDSAFRLTGISNQNINPAVRNYLRTKFTDRVGDAMPHNAFKFAGDFVVDATVLRDTTAHNGYELVLNQSEYDQFMSLLSLMLGDNLIKDRNDFRKQLVASYLKAPALRRKLPYKQKVIKKWTLAHYYDVVLGIPLSNEFLSNTSIRQLTKVKNVDREAFKAYMSFLNDAVRRIKNYTAKEGMFVENGQKYYRIKGTLFHP